MTRAELEHVLRAASAIVGEGEFVVVGSQAILGAFPQAPEELRISREADIYPLHAPHLADLIDGAIGELSPFDQQFGYYAHGVGEETAILPPSWLERCVPVSGDSTGGAVGYCLHPVDLAVSKLAAARTRDIEFVTTMIRHGLVDAEEVKAAARDLPPSHRDAVGARLAHCRRQAAQSGRDP